MDFNVRDITREGFLDILDIMDEGGSVTIDMAVQALAVPATQYKGPEAGTRLMRWAKGHMERATRMASLDKYGLQLRVRQWMKNLTAEDKLLFLSDYKAIERIDDTGHIVLNPIFESTYRKTRDGGCPRISYKTHGKGGDKIIPMKNGDRQRLFYTKKEDKRSWCPGVDVTQEEWRYVVPYVSYQSKLILEAFLHEPDYKANKDDIERRLGITGMDNSLTSIGRKICAALPGLTVIGLQKKKAYIDIPALYIEWFPDTLTYALRPELMEAAREYFDEVGHPAI